MSYKTYATIGAITLSFLLAAGVFAPTSALAHHNQGHTANCNGFPESPHCQESTNEEQDDNNGGNENTPYTLRVNSTDLQGNTLTGYYTVIELEGEEVHNGFTPIEFTGNNGTTYTVTVHDFEEVTFHHWDDDSIERTRMVTLNADTTITAYYTVPSGNEEEDEEDAPEQTTQQKTGKNWTGAIKFSEQLQAHGLYAENLPASDTLITTYEATTGPLGMNLFEVLDGLHLAGINWSELTNGQKVWLLENFYRILNGEL
jgi:hypothetical protein